jgi:energy-coupling factor transporter ATP-binding protein EcfA2
MSKIKIKNFGPIKEGYQQDDGFMEIKKVNVFIGNQGSGKSTVAKVISTLVWIEKAINRGDFSEAWTFHEFKEQFKYQNLIDYFREDTVIDYMGEQYSICYDVFINQWPIIKKQSELRYVVPKIMYVPSERNFLSVIKEAYGVRGLSEPLFEFAEELRKSEQFIGSDGILLPINNVFYKYDYTREIGVIYNQDYSINMLAASSGFQSLVPLFLVSNNLANLISNSDSELNSDAVSVNQKIRVNKQIAEVMLAKNMNDAKWIL